MKTPNAGEDVEKLDYSYMLVKILNGIATLGKSLEVSYKTNHATTLEPSNYTLGHLSQRNEDLYHIETCT